MSLHHNAKRHSFEPFNCDLKQLRKRDDGSLEKSLISFLKQNPTPTQLHKLYDTMLIVARDDSIGEGYHYVNNITREEFDFYCAYIPIADSIQKEAKQHVSKFLRSLRTKRTKKTAAQNVNEYIPETWNKRFATKVKVADKWKMQIEVVQIILEKKYNMNAHYYGTNNETVSYISVAYEILSHLGVM